MTRSLEGRHRRRNAGGVTRALRNADQAGRLVRAIHLAYAGPGDAEEREAALGLVGLSDVADIAQSFASTRPTARMQAVYEQRAQRRVREALNGLREAFPRHPTIADPNPFDLWRSYYHRFNRQRGSTVMNPPSSSAAAAGTNFTRVPRLPLPLDSNMSAEHASDPPANFQPRRMLDSAQEGDAANQVSTSRAASIPPQQDASSSPWLPVTDAAAPLALEPPTEGFIFLGDHGPRQQVANATASANEIPATQARSDNPEDDPENRLSGYLRRLRGFSYSYSLRARDRHPMAESDQARDPPDAQQAPGVSSPGESLDGVLPDLVISRLGLTPAPPSAALPDFEVPIRADLEASPPSSTAYQLLSEGYPGRLLGSPGRSPRYRIPHDDDEDFPYARRARVVNSVLLNSEANENRATLRTSAVGPTSPDAGLRWPRSLVRPTRLGPRYDPYTDLAASGTFHLAHLVDPDEPRSPLDPASPGAGPMQTDSLGFFGVRDIHGLLEEDELRLPSVGASGHGVLGAPSQRRRTQQSSLAAASLPRVSPTKFLSTGFSFEGTQTYRPEPPTARKLEDWIVRVDITQLDWDSGRVSGIMSAKGIPCQEQPIDTYWDGEIIDNRNFTFNSAHYDVEEHTDLRQWSQFSGFHALRPQLQGAEMLCSTLHESPCVFMRWKEREFMSEFKSMSLQRELTIAGFYYVCLVRQTGEIEGFYHDAKSVPYQRLTLRPAREADGHAFGNVVFS